MCTFSQDLRQRVALAGKTWLGVSEAQKLHHWRPLEQHMKYLLGHGVVPDVAQLANNCVVYGTKGGTGRQGLALGGRVEHTSI